MNYYIIAGLLLNAALIVINRFFIKLPDWLQIPCLIVGIALLIIGIIHTR